MTVVAIDGPGGSGKSTVAAALAKRLGLPHVDTGAYYRAATLAVLRAGVRPDDPQRCADAVAAARIERRQGRTFLNGEDVEDEIRGPAVTARVSAVSAIPPVRELMVERQRAEIGPAGAVVEGRDAGTVVVPGADLKVWLTAGPEERAARRAAQVGLVAADAVAEHARALARRDALDADQMARAPGVVEIDTTDLSVAALVEQLARRLEQPDTAVRRDGVGEPGSHGDRPMEASPSTSSRRNPGRRVRPRGGALVAVVGRPNVGKSTLVNRFVGRRDAIVQERPGVTRDRTAHAVQWRGRTFTVVDTGGWVPGWAREAALEAAVSAQAEQAIAEADLVLLVVDATVGITEEDATAASWLRRAGVPTLLVANKVDDLAPASALASELTELNALGLGEPRAVSALHGLGSGDLLDDVYDHLQDSGAFDRPPEPEDAIPGVALIGRPNVGKSSIFNRLLGQERAIVDERPGTTRDAVDTVVELHDGRAYRFVDTAGLRKHARRGDTTEYYATIRTVRALDRAAVALLVIDASEPIGEQEQRLARRIIDAGRALVLVLNKWDLVDEERREWVDRERDRLLRFVDWAPVVRTAATTGRGINRLLPAVDTVLQEWERRVPTAVLNGWLPAVVEAAPPPLQRGRPVRFRYVTQVAVGPPTFRFFTTGEVPAGYLRYLERRLREDFGFQGTPLDVAVRMRARWEERAAGSGGR